MENVAMIDADSKHNSASSRSAGRNIDGFFRPRTTKAIRPTAQPIVENSIAALVSQSQTLPSAPEILETERKQHLSITRAVNHTRAHLPQAARSRTIEVSHTTAQAQPLTVHRQSNHVRHRATQHSQTLRRDGVATPSISTHNLLRPAGTLQHKEPGSIAAKNSVSTIDVERLARAQNAPKSALVARHAAPSRNVLPTLTSLAVQPTPTTPPIVPPSTPGNGGIPPVPAPQPDNKPTDIFEHALANAGNFVDLHAHRARYRKKARTHVVSMAMGSLALIVIASFIAYQNSPLLQFKVASIKAGISAEMPNFAAAGFIYRDVQANDGKLTFGFNGTNGSYQLTQSNTNLSDADMIQTIGATTASGMPTYQVLMAGNTMVYRFNSTNATWVSDGQWYTVSGSHALTDQQVQSIVQHA